MFGPESHVVVVVGAQWGDEGKGKLVDVLAERVDWVVRYLNVWHRGCYNFVCSLYRGGDP